MRVTFEFADFTGAVDVTPEVLGDLHRLVESGAVTKEFMSALLRQVEYYQATSRLITGQYAGMTVVIAGQQVVYAASDLDDACAWLTESPEHQPAYIAEVPATDPTGQFIRRVQYHPVTQMRGLTFARPTIFRD